MNSKLRIRVQVLENTVEKNNASLKESKEDGRG